LQKKSKKEVTVLHAKSAEALAGTFTAFVTKIILNYDYLWL